jgi:transposase
VSKLNTEQTQILLQHLQKHTYLFAKDIAAYVKTLFGIEYTVAGMTAWLQQHGFSYKKPAIVPGKANYETQEQWVKQYEALKSTLPVNESICFIDGVHPTHNTKPAFGWIQKGERKEIPTNSGRQRMNLSGAIDIITKRVFIQEDLSLNALSTLAFLKGLEAAYPEASKVHVFCDNAKYYKNKEVTAYLKCSKIEMHFLPPYSPNLNPIERLWKFMNEKILYNKYYEKFSVFREEVLKFLDSLADPPPGVWQELTKRISDSFHLVSKKANAPA